MRNIVNPGAFDWLDKVVKGLNAFYADELELVPGGASSEHVSVVDSEKHGRCIQVAYRIMFLHKATNPYTTKLPVEDGPYLMDLIKRAAKDADADPPLVSTVDPESKKRDFCDWFIMEDGHGEMRFFFEGGR